MMTADPYDTAKANLRDNIKLSITMFGGVTAVLLAGTPFSGYAGLERFGASWWVATVAMLVAVGLLAWAVRILLFILRPDPVTLDMLTDSAADREIQAVKDAFHRHRHSLLPPELSDQVNGLERLVEAKTEASNAYFEARDAQASPQQVEGFKQAYDNVCENLDVISFWAGYALLRERFMHGLDRVLWIGLAAIIAIAVFVLASATADKRALSPTEIFLIAPPGPDQSRQPPLPTLLPVFFATGSAALSDDAVKRIGAARTYLRTHPGTGLLIFANTDTRGGNRLNASLSARRAEQVASLLRSGGGISPSRIFLTPLAKTDLPILTPGNVRSDANRSVEMLLIPLPARQQ